MSRDIVTVSANLGPAVATAASVAFVLCQN
jgi:hypothetical protein